MYFVKIYSIIIARRTELKHWK